MVALNNRDIKGFDLLDYAIRLRTVSDIVPQAFVVSVDDVEEISGIDYFPALPDYLEEELESIVNIHLWFTEHSNN